MTTRSRLSLMMKLRCGSEPAACWLSSCCCRRRASARVAYVPLSSSPSYTLYGARGSSSLTMLRLTRRQLILQRHPLELFVEMFDSIFKLALYPRHVPHDRTSPAGCICPPVLG